MKFTDEQLSRVLSHAHELKRGGMYRYQSDSACGVGCVNQAAYNVDADDAIVINPVAMNAFDRTKAYDDNRTPDFVLALLERAGVA